MTTEIARVTDSTPPTLVRDLLEARARRLMAQRAALPNAWPHRAERAELLAEVDATLTAYNDTVH